VSGGIGQCPTDSEEAATETARMGMVTLRCRGGEGSGVVEMSCKGGAEVSIP
jgi:hypothetical protein